MCGDWGRQFHKQILSIHLFADVRTRDERQLHHCAADSTLSAAANASRFDETHVLYKGGFRK